MGENAPVTTLTEYATQSRFSDPGPYADLFDQLPTDLHELTAVVRNMIVHYRASGIPFPEDRLEEVNSRWVDRMLDADRTRFDTPLAQPRPIEQRCVGCCRDFTLLSVAALRHRGVPARSRVGFAAYFSPDFNYDHVITEYHDGDRWVFVDAQLDPGAYPFDTHDIPRLVGAKPPSPPLFATSAQVWTAMRRDEIDRDRYGVAPDILFLRGEWFVQGYVLRELAHRQRDELLLWDSWGCMSPQLNDDDIRVGDEIAALLLAADDGDAAAEKELSDRYARDERVRPAEIIGCFTPMGGFSRIDLRTREALD
jgi:hypothetical protein